MPVLTDSFDHFDSPSNTISVPLSEAIFHFNFVAGAAYYNEQTKSLSVPLRNGITERCMDCYVAQDVKQEGLQSALDSISRASPSDIFPVWVSDLGDPIGLTQEDTHVPREKIRSRRG